MGKETEDKVNPSAEVIAEENGWHADLEKNHEASSSNSEVKETGEIKGDNIQNQEDGDKKEENKYTVPFYRLFSFADSIDVFLMILGSVGALANGAALPLMTVLFGNLIQSFGGAKDIHDVVHRVSKVALEFIYLAVGSGVSSFLQVSCWMVTRERQAARIRNLYLKAILRQEIAFFDMETSTGEVVGRMSGDTVLIQDAMGEKVGKFIQLISTFFGGFIVAFVQGWLLSLVMLSIIPLVVVAGALMSIVVSKMASKSQTAYGDAAVIVQQAIGSIRTVASFTGEKISVCKYKNALRNAYTSSVQEGLAAGVGLGFAMFFMFCSYSLGIWYGGKLILDKSKGYSGADVINVIFALITGSFSLGQASPCLSSFAAGQAAAYKMFEMINRKPEIDAYDTNGRKLDDIRGDIEFRDVYFSYPARSGEQIFRGFSLLINSGTTTALVGESGSGKSTVISLIERFYDPQTGEVLIDGTNIKDLQLRWLRGKIGLVSQEPVLFASSIKDNISYGKDNATTEEIRVAAELANASKFIDKMPQGLDTMVGEHGTQLSGGQKQRIAIARAILKDPKILLLDEATSALDAESERVVQEALDRVMMNRTTVIVAHRLSTVRNADIIAVVHRGSIVEKGSHSELIKDSNGAYSQLIRLQEMNQNSDSMSQSDNEKRSLSLDGTRRSSQHMSIKQSISRDSSFGHSSRHHSLSAGFGLPVGIDVLVHAPDAPNSSTTEQSKEVPLSRLASLNKPEIPILLLGAAFSIINGTIFPAFGVILSSVINTFYQPPDKLKKDSKFWSLMFLIFGVVSLTAEPAKSYFFGVAGSRLIRRIRFMTFEKVVNMEIAWFDDSENSSGAIGARLSADAASVRSLVGDALSLIVQNITTLIAGLLIAFIANWQLSLIILAMIPLISLNGLIQVKFMQGFSADAKLMYEEASQVANDAVGSIRTVASFSAEEKVMELYKKKCEGPMRTGIRQGLISGIGFGVSFFLLFCVYAACFYAGARLVEDGKTTFGKVFRVFFALSMAAMGISQSSSLAPDSTKAKSATASVFSILDRESKIDPSDDTGMTLDAVRGNIEFCHITFKYPTRPDVQIFQDLCLSVKSGKTVALVGESGSGKSTAIALLQRFYDPDSGHILLDAIKLQKFKLRWLRQQMGLVSQEPVMFNDTIRANIAYGKEGKATEAEIVAAAEAANAHKFICSLQQGYDTMVGERGIQLSGGQKQRIAISRAIVKDPKILLLDEATSALDAESERIVQDALDRVMVNRTTVVVAHRLTTIKNADLIALVKNGVIIEKGKHNILIDINGGAYASLVALHSSSTTS
ncbi:ABC transporter B family member 11-like [Phalaenopsis equestris]|uniref:ABC transporter B family member 11-like n=1 Tax=Phalaenopsis equestris TaxID=78828 RepID=UPI0009E63A74|nr:ABC transporter B family member 11-like [Phalaenopsis equestris]XP_020593547.1 ABC transporter B family member 11-like [Phalaenopsis equestris]